MKTTHLPSTLLCARSLYGWLAASALTALTVAHAAASQAIIHFQAGDTKEDQIVTIDLFDANAPQTVANFKALVAKKFYKGIVVHRVVPETLVQMGDPLSRKKDRSATGTGGPGYTLPAEIGRKHVRGGGGDGRVTTGAQSVPVVKREPVLHRAASAAGVGQGLHGVRPSDEWAGLS